MCASLFSVCWESSLSILIIIISRFCILSNFCLLTLSLNDLWICLWNHLSFSSHSRLILLRSELIYLLLLFLRIWSTGLVCLSFHPLVQEIKFNFMQYCPEYLQETLIQPLNWPIDSSTLQFISGFLWWNGILESWKSWVVSR